MGVHSRRIIEVMPLEAHQFSAWDVFTEIRVQCRGCLYANPIGSLLPTLSPVLSCGGYAIRELLTVDGFLCLVNSWLKLSPVSTSQAPGLQTHVADSHPSFKVVAGNGHSLSIPSISLVIKLSFFGVTVYTTKRLHFSKVFSGNEVYHETILDSGI